MEYFELPLTIGEITELVMGSYRQSKGCCLFRLTCLVECLERRSRIADETVADVPGEKNDGRRSLL